MQIMNGFKELYEHKIMHRDIKLANIFLDNDTIVIGDFGFAKMDSELTRTRLGTPLTMSPEMLDEDDKAYSNKADLWSIGCVFYQLVCGRAPYTAKNYKELKKIVLNFASTESVFIPKEVSLSKECLDLLNGLFKYLPEERIEWKDFFHHPLFKLHCKLVQKETMQDSVFLGDKHEDVQEQFGINRINSKSGEIQLTHPEQIPEIKISPLKVKESYQMKGEKKYMSDLDQDSEEYKTLYRIKKFFLHERNKTRWFIHGARCFMNLITRKGFPERLNIIFMYCSALLFTKAALKTYVVVESLKGEDNRFELDGYDQFLELKDVKQIHKNFRITLTEYTTFGKDYRKIFKLEDQPASVQTTFSRITSYTLGDMNLMESVMLDNFLILIQILKSKDGLSVSEQNKNLFAEALLKFYYSIRCDESFPFTKDGDYFNWEQIFTQFKSREFIFENLYNFESGIFVTCV